MEDVKELKLINWFLSELKNSREKEITQIDNTFDMLFVLYSGKIDNMDFNIDNSKMILTSTSNLFNNKYDINLDYDIQDKKNEVYLHKELHKYAIYFNKKHNSSILNDIIEKIEDKDKDINLKPSFIIKVDIEYKDFMDKSYNYLGESRIDGKLIYLINILLPPFDLIKAIE